MSFTYIIKLVVIATLIFLYSCNYNLTNFKTADTDLKDNNIVSSDNSYIQIDTKLYSNLNKNYVDNYTYTDVNTDFLDKKKKLIKINNNNFNNAYIVQSRIYSINNKSELVIFNSENGKLISKHAIKSEILNKVPVSFSMINEDFIVGFKSGEVVRINKLGEQIWIFNYKGLLSTPIMIHDNYLIILYSQEIILLSLGTGQKIFEKKHNTNNIIQSSGGKIVNYSNLIYYLLPNSELGALDTFVLDYHLSQLDNMETSKTLNNLNDNIHIYKNYFVYLNNGNLLNTFDIINDKKLLSDFRINKSNSSVFFNNVLVSKNDTKIEFYNIINGDLVADIDVSKIFKNHTKIIKIIPINNKLHLFDNNGKILILNNKFDLENKIDLKITNIKSINNHQGKLFIHNNKGSTYIFK